MQHHLESLIGRRWNKVTGEEVKILVADIELVSAAVIPLPKASFANLIGDIEVVKCVPAIGRLEKRAHPCPTGGRIGWKVQHDGHPALQQFNQMRCHSVA